MSSPETSLLAGAFLLAAAVAFDAHCIHELERADITFLFPPQVWLLLIVLATPFGGIAYLKLGRRG